MPAKESKRSEKRKEFLLGFASTCMIRQLNTSDTFDSTTDMLMIKATAGPGSGSKVSQRLTRYQALARISMCEKYLPGQIASVNETNFPRNIIAGTAKSVNKSDIEPANAAKIQRGLAAALVRHSRPNDLNIELIGSQ